MARKRRSSTDRTDAIFHTPLPSLAPLIRPSASPSFPSEPFSDVEDRRTYHPLDQYRPAMEIGGTSAPQPKVKKSFKRQLPFGLQFAVPQNTIICIRRKRRKEVIFALGKNGGGRRRRKPRRNPYSNVGC